MLFNRLINSSLLTGLPSAAVLLLLAMLSSLPSYGQGGRNVSDRFDVVNVGLGMSNRGLPLFVELEQSLDEHISAGLIASYRSYKEGGSSGTWQHQFLGVGAQGHYHFTEVAPEPFDFFAGLTLAWYAHSFRSTGGQFPIESYTGSTVGGLQLAGHIGGRYTYKDWTLFTQLTGGSLLSDFTVGLSIPLK